MYNSFEFENNRLLNIFISNLTQDEGLYLAELIEKVPNDNEKVMFLFGHRFGFSKLSLPIWWRLKEKYNSFFNENNESNLFRIIANKWISVYLV